MTGSQRTRLVLALGAVNLVLAVVAFGLAGTIEPPDQTGRASASPVASVPPVAAGSPSPSAAPPTSGPAVSEPPAATSAPTPATSPVTGGEPGTSGPGPTDAVIARPATSAPPPTDAPPPTGEPPPLPTPTAAPPVQPPAQPAAKPRPACPGTVAGAPGLQKGSGDPTRPCRGGEDERGGSSGGVDLARGDERGQTRTKPWRGRSKREVA